MREHGNTERMGFNPNNRQLHGTVELSSARKQREFREFLSTLVSPKPVEQIRVAQPSQN